MWKMCASLLFLSTSVFSILHAKDSIQERTLSIIKPDGVAAHHIGEIIAQFEKKDLNVVGIKMLHLSKERAGEFYAIHKNKPFYAALVEFMTSGPIVVMVLEGKDAIARNRKIMGSTDPKKAEKGTLRRRFAKSVQQNTVHGSDAPETAKTEIAFFFTPEEIFSK
jgi:nucleoside-diphosphate kinase